MNGIAGGEAQFKFGLDVRVKLVTYIGQPGKADGECFVSQGCEVADQMCGGRVWNPLVIYRGGPSGFRTLWR